MVRLGPRCDAGPESVNLRKGFRQFTKRRQGRSRRILAELFQEFNGSAPVPKPKVREFKFSAPLETEMGHRLSTRPPNINLPNCLDLKARADAVDWIGNLDRDESNSGFQNLWVFCMLYDNRVRCSWYPAPGSSCPALGKTLEETFAQPGQFSCSPL